MRMRYSLRWYIRADTVASIHVAIELVFGAFGDGDTRDDGVCP